MLIHMMCHMPYNGAIVPLKAMSVVTKVTFLGKESLVVNVSICFREPRRLTISVMINLAFFSLELCHA